MVHGAVFTVELITTGRARCECEYGSDRGPVFQEGAEPLGREQIPAAMGHPSWGSQMGFM